MKHGREGRRTWTCEIRSPSFRAYRNLPCIPSRRRQRPATLSAHPPDRWAPDQGPSGGRDPPRSPRGCRRHRPAPPLTHRRAPAAASEPSGRFTEQLEETGARPSGTVADPTTVRLAAAPGGPTLAHVPGEESAVKPSHGGRIRCRPRFFHLDLPEARRTRRGVSARGRRGIPGRPASARASHW